jgi:hypothetical protein
LLSLAIAITGSVWPIQARSIEAIFDTGAARVVFVRGNSHGDVVAVPTGAAALRKANTG